jgi:hypothetical protein
VTGLRGHGNERSGSIKCEESFVWLRDYWLLKKDYAAWS